MPQPVSIFIPAFTARNKEVKNTEIKDYLV